MLETGDLFGLHRRYRVLTEPHFLLVYPEGRAAGGLRIRLAAADRRSADDAPAVRRPDADRRRAALRGGDPLNRVHWRATARTGHAAQQDLRAVDRGRGHDAARFSPGALTIAQHEPYRSELAVTAAASLANAVFQMGQQVGLVTNGRDAADRIRQEGWDYDIRIARRRQTGRRHAATPATACSRWSVETRRGPEQLMRILETLARVELTDGLSLAQLVWRNRRPHAARRHGGRDLTAVSAETAVALGNLRRRGFAVTAIVNMFEDHEFAEAAGKLLAERIDTRHLKDETSVSEICRMHALRRRAQSSTHPSAGGLAANPSKRIVHAPVWPANSTRR